MVGAHLLLHIAGKGNKLRALYRTENTISRTKNLFTHYGKAELFNSIEWVQGDITDIPTLEEAFKGVDYEYQAAALISFDPADEEKLRKINIEGTANVVNCALDFGVKKLCYVSSVAALGDLKFGETITTEETEWNPEKTHSDYAISKYGAEMEVWRGWQEGLDVVVVNPGIIFGYGFWQQGSGHMFTSLYKGQHFYTKGVCGIVAVEDVAAIMVKLMESEVTGERFTLVAENMSIEAILNTIADGMGKKHPAMYATPAMTSVAWRIDWLLSKLLSRPRNFTRPMARSAHTVENYSSDKVIKLLDYDFTTMTAYLHKLAAGFILR